jgi:hypothetical protein
LRSENVGVDLGVARQFLKRASFISVQQTTCSNLHVNKFLAVYTLLTRPLSPPNRTLSFNLLSYEDFASVFCVISISQRAERSRYKRLTDHDPASDPQTMNASDV